MSTFAPKLSGHGPAPGYAKIGQTPGEQESLLPRQEMGEKETKIATTERIAMRANVGIVLALIGLVGVAVAIVLAIVLHSPTHDPLTVGTLTVTGNHIVGGNLGVGGNVDVDGDQNIDGSLVVGGTITKKRERRKVTRRNPQTGRDETMMVDVNGASRFSGSIYADDAVTIGDAAVIIAKDAKTAPRAAGGQKPIKLSVIDGSATVGGDLIVEGNTTTQDLIIANKTRKIIHVGPTREIKKVSDALMRFNGRHTGEVSIFVDPGLYSDTINIGQNSSSNPELYNPDDTTGGAEIIGDTRQIAALTYVDGAPLRIPAIQDMLVSTDVSGVGPYDSLLGTFASATPVSALGKHAPGDFEGCSSPGPSTYYTGKIALIKRGTCAFLLKAQIAFDHGAVGVIIYLANPGDALFIMSGGMENQLDKAVVLVSNIAGLALVANPSATITLTVSAPPFGTPGTTVDITQPSATSIAISTSGQNPNFTALGIVPGDRVAIIKQNPLEDAEMEILSVSSGNVLTFTTALPFSMTGSYASVTFLPNVRMIGQTNKPTLTVHQGSGVTVKGVAFLVNSAFTFGQQNPTVIVPGGYLNCLGCALYVHSNQTGGIYITDKGYLGTTDARLVSDPYLFQTFIGGNWLSVEHTTVRAEYVTMISGGEVFAEDSLVQLTSLTMINGNQLAISGSPALGLHRSASYAGRYIFMAGSGSGSPSILLDGQSQMTLENLIIKAPEVAQGYYSTGIELRQQSRLHVSVTLSVSDCGDAVIIDGSSSVAVDALPIFSNNLFTGNSGYGFPATPNVITFGDAKYDVTDADAVFYGVPAPQRWTHLQNGDLDNYYRTQYLMNTTNSNNINLVPYAAFGDGAELIYVGKSFKLVNVYGVNHTVTLVDPWVEGPVFVGIGATGTESVYTFPTTEGSSIEFTILNGHTVVVTQTNGGTFSVPAKKRKTRDPPSSFNATHALHMYEMHKMPLSIGNKA